MPIIDMLPIQLKHNHETHEIDTKIGLDYLKEKSISENECILLVEGNHVTGETVNIATNMLKEKFGENLYSRFSPFTND